MTSQKSTPHNLSLLSRGIGEVINNGHEHINVMFEPEDYYNWADDPNRMFKPAPPPLPPPAPHPPVQKKDHWSLGDLSHRSLQGSELHLSRTFTTRKGALLLFSEDFAAKHREHKPYRRKGRMHSEEDLGSTQLNSVVDLASAILAYGGREKEDVFLGFTPRRYRDLQQRNIRPGFSARRYLASWMKNFDEDKLGRMMDEGKIQERNLWQVNYFLPQIKKRVTEDLSHNPVPYRIMHAMLQSPGSMAGYTFVREGTEDSISDAEEERPLTTTTIKVLRHEDGSRREVTYSRMSQEDKEQILSELLMKSAVNYALAKHQEAVERGEEEEQEGHGDGADSGMSGTKEVTMEQLDMRQAMESLLDGGNVHSKVLDTGSIPPARNPSHASEGGGSFRGSVPLSHRSAVEEENEDAVSAASRSLPPPSGEKEFVAGLPVVSLRSSVAGSSRSSSPGGGSSERLPPIASAEDADKIDPLNTPASHFPKESTIPTLPPIDGAQASGKDISLPAVKLMPATPQATTLTGTGGDGGISRELTRVTPLHMDREELPREAAWGSTIDESDEIKAARDSARESEKQAEEEKRKGRLLEAKSKSGSLQSLHSLPSSRSSSSKKGPVFAAGSHLETSSATGADGHAAGDTGSMVSHHSTRSKPPLAPSWKGSQRSLRSEGQVSKRESDSAGKGSVIMAPGGEVVNVGGAIRAPSSVDTSDEVAHAQHIDTAPGSEKGSVVESGDEGEDWQQHVQKAQTSSASRHSRLSGSRVSGSRASDSRAHSGSRASSVALSESMRGFVDNKRDVDLSGGDLDATRSLKSVSIKRDDASDVESEAELGQETAKSRVESRTSKRRSAATSAASKAGGARGLESPLRSKPPTPAGPANTTARSSRLTSRSSRDKPEDDQLQQGSGSRAPSAASSGMSFAASDGRGDVAYSVPSAHPFTPLSLASALDGQESQGERSGSRPDTMYSVPAGAGFTPAEGSLRMGTASGGAGSAVSSSVRNDASRAGSGGSGAHRGAFSDRHYSAGTNTLLVPCPGC